MMFHAVAKCCLLSSSASPDPTGQYDALRWPNYGKDGTPCGRCCLPCRNVLNKVFTDKRYPGISQWKQLLDRVLHSQAVRQDFLNGRTTWIKHHSQQDRSRDVYLIELAVF